MKASQPDRLDFANSLRGIASLMVLIAHYILVFDYIKGGFAGLPALSSNPLPRWLVSAFSFAPDINPGPLGVSLFFLISGLVIPNSIAGYSKTARGRLAFIVARFFRIWPTYLCGFAVSVLALYVAARYSGTPFVFTSEQIVVHLTLFRDWFGSIQMDGVVWTLEIEAKFYLLALIFWRSINNGRMWVFAAVALAAVLAMPYKPTFPNAWLPPSNFLFAIKYILYMTIGVAFNYQRRGLIDLRQLFAVSVALLALFVYCCIEEKVSNDVIVSYIVSFVIFSYLYLCRQQWTGGRIIKFFADISYPLYASHAAFGYVGMRIMIDKGLPSLLALVIQIGITLTVAWLLHKLVENPTHRIGKQLATGFVGARRQTGLILPSQVHLRRTRR